MNNFYNKYLKYKNKYSSLKYKQSGGCGCGLTFEKISEEYLEQINNQAFRRTRDINVIKKNGKIIFDPRESSHVILEWHPGSAPSTTTTKVIQIIEIPDENTLRFNYPADYTVLVDRAPIYRINKTQIVSIEQISNARVPEYEAKFNK